MGKKTEKRSRLRDLHLSRVSFVDAGASPGAHIEMFKSFKKEAEVPDPIKKEELSEDAQALVTGLEEERDKFKTDLEALQTKNTETEGSVAEMKKELDELKKSKEDPEPDPIEKMSPEQQAIFKAQEIRLAEVEKKAAATEAANADLVEKQARLVYVSKAAPLIQHLPTTADDLGELLHKVASGANTEVADKLIEILSAANVMGEEYSALKALGSDAGYGSSDAMDVIEKKASELKKANPELSIDQAIDRVMKSNPELYAQYQDEHKSSRQ